VQKALLDTNVLIWREAAQSPREDIGHLFYWLDRLEMAKCVHPKSLAEIGRYHDPKVANAVLIRSESYIKLLTAAKMSEGILRLYNSAVDENTKVDLQLLSELAAGRVDVLITEDKGIHRAARDLGISGVLSIVDFVTHAKASQPHLPSYDVQSVQKTLIGDLDFSDHFFDSLRASYQGFDHWLNRKADEPAYILRTPTGLGAFLYLKFEGPNEHYGDIFPPFSAKRRLKIGTFKVTYKGFRVGERLLHIAFDAAVASNADEIYVTMHGKGDEQAQLRKLLEHWGFQLHGTKTTTSGQESVLVRSVFAPGNFDNPFFQYPRAKRSAKHFVVPIYPQYHTELFPESILKTESANNFVEHAAYRNGIAKSYVSRSWERDASPGDNLLFYRTGGMHTSVITTLCIVEKLIKDIVSFEEFSSACRRRSVFTDKELLLHWNYRPADRPFVVHLLHAQSFKKRPNRRKLLEAGLIPAAPPRGLTPINQQQFEEILRLGEVNGRIVVD
jgi:hypothetical protein